MGRRVMMSVDPDFRDLVKDIKKRKIGLTEREITKEMANELTGRNLFERKKRKEFRNENIFNL